MFKILKNLLIISIINLSKELDLIFINYLYFLNLNNNINIY